MGSGNLTFFELVFVISLSLIVVSIIALIVAYNHKKTKKIKLLDIDPKLIFKLFNKNNTPDFFINRENYCKKLLNEVNYEKIKKILEALKRIR